MIDHTYGFARFPIREGQSWLDARLWASIDPLGIGLRRAYRFPAGLIVGFDDSVALEDVTEIISDAPVDTLYAGQVSDVCPQGPFETSPRERADEALSIRATVPLFEMFPDFLDVAARAALVGSMICGFDQVTNRPTNPHPNSWWAAIGRGLPEVVAVTDTERAAIVKGFTDEFRAVLQQWIYGSGAPRRAGRREEEQRDHEAYCLRERLLRSQEYTHLNKNARASRVKQRVLAEVILARRPNATCSPSNWTKIMAKGKAVHERVASGTPFCERA